MISLACMIVNWQLTSRLAISDWMLFIRHLSLSRLNRQWVCAGSHGALKSSCVDGRGAGLGPEPYSDGAFPWQWAAPQLNSPPLFMHFGGEAGIPPRDRWPFSHKVLCLDLACSGARQQSSDDTAFGKQLPDAEVVATESIENWLTHRASNQMTGEAAQSANRAGGGRRNKGHQR